MTIKVKGILSILLSIISVYMMMTTKYFNAIGDYVLVTIGLRAWSHYNCGLHLTVLYFGVFFIIGLHYVRKYVIDTMKLSRRYVVFIFLAAITLLYLLTNMVAENIKENSEGLFSVGYDSKSSNIEYQMENSKYVRFNVQVKLTNYSNESKEFYIYFNDFFDQDETAINEIQINELNGELALFKLNAKQTKSFSITLTDYDVKSVDKLGDRGRSGYIEGLILKDIYGNKIRLDSNNFFGIELSK